MLKIISKIIIGFAMVSSFTVHAGHYSSVKKTNNLSSIYGATPVKGQVLLYSQFIEPNHFVGTEFQKMIQPHIGVNPYQMTFVGRGSYKTPITVDRLQMTFFHNIANIQYLLGSDYSISAIDQNPYSFIFQSSRDLPFVSDLVGTVAMRTLEGNQAPADLLMNIQNITGRHSNPHRIVVQDMYGFNKHVLAVKMVTALYPTQGGTDVEVLSVSVFYDFPSFGSSFIESNSEQDLLGYAERLYLLN